MPNRGNCPALAAPAALIPDSGPELKFKDYILARSGNNNIVVKMLQWQQQWEQGHYKCQSGDLSFVIMCIYNCVCECGANS